MVFNSCFDIIGPIMVGPSSSHTAGAVSIGRFVHEWLGGVPDWTEIMLYGSFADTYQGHGTDKAIVGGLLGMEAASHGIRESKRSSIKEGLVIKMNPRTDIEWKGHPNTVYIHANRSGYFTAIEGVSIGGGLSEIRSINGEAVCIDIPADSNIKQIADTHKSRLAGRL